MRFHCSVRVLAVFVTAGLLAATASAAIRGSVDRRCPAASFFYKNDEPRGGATVRIEVSVTVPEGRTCDLEVTWTDANGIPRKYLVQTGESLGLVTSLPPQGVIHWACRGSHRQCRFDWEVDVR